MPLQQVFSKRYKRPIKLFLLFLLIVFANFGPLERVPITNLFYFNLTNSQPKGLYLVVDKSAIQKGDYVIILPPSHVVNSLKERPWFNPSVPLLKTVAALSSDSYNIDDQSISINGTYWGPIFEKDKQGVPLPQIRGKFTVQDGYFLPLASRIPNSFDGRYFGEVPLNSVVAKVIPLIVLPEG